MRGGPLIQIIQRESGGKIQHQNINATKVSIIFIFCCFIIVCLDGC